MALLSAVVAMPAEGFVNSLSGHMGLACSLSSRSTNVDIRSIIASCGNFTAATMASWISVFSIPPEPLYLAHY